MRFKLPGLWWIRSNSKTTLLLCPLTRWAEKSSWEMKWKIWISLVWGRGTEPGSPASLTYASLECNYWMWDVPGILKHMWCRVLSWCTAQLLAVYTTDLWSASRTPALRPHWKNKKNTWKDNIWFFFFFFLLFIFKETIYILYGFQCFQSLAEVLCKCLSDQASHWI